MSPLQGIAFLAIEDRADLINEPRCDIVAG